MIDESRDVDIIELGPGSYWQGSGSVGCASLATPVYPGGTAYALEIFSREAFPNVRRVRVRISARELLPQEVAAPFERYGHLLLDWVTCLIGRKSFSADEEEALSKELFECLLEMTPEDREKLTEPYGRLMASWKLKVFLDDEREVPEGWVSVKTARGACRLLEHVTVTHLSLDHDLGKEHGTGYDVVCWLESAVVTDGYPMPVVTIHSDNPVGRQNMQRGLDSIEALLDVRRRQEAEFLELHRRQGIER